MKRKVNKGELYNSSNIKKLFRVLPGAIVDKALEYFDKNSDNEGKLRALTRSLELYRSNAQQRMQLDLAVSVNLVVNLEKNQKSESQKISTVHKEGEERTVPV